MTSKAEKTKQYIIERAAPIFNEKGIAGTSVDDVLKAASVAKGCLYNHFEDKAALSSDVADYLLEKISSSVGAVISKADTAHGKILAYLEFSKNPFETPVNGGCPIFNLAVESDDNNPKIREKVKVAFEASHKLFSSILKMGIKSGEYKESLNADEFAIKLYSSIEGTIVICRVVNSNKPMLTLIKSLKKELEEYLT
ncbi:MAG TPA: TetR/AcrR family transcriptional regulator [Ohtaekwangia sp.]|uniref:TetR/AcrR family transcriptional regulator n=1 Tax=Ohtaekwangia sp. TaxID=2066019 RepID=UPI002F922B2B